MKKTSFLLVLCISVCLTSLAVSTQHTWVLKTIDEGGLCGEYPSAAITSTGDFLVSSFANGKLKLLRSFVNGDEICWSEEIVDNNGIVGEYSSIAIDEDNNPIIGYHDVDNTSLKVARFDGTEWLIDTVDYEEAVSGRQISIAIAPDDNPAVAYFHATPGWTDIILRYAWFDGIDWHKENLPSSRPPVTNQLSLQFAPDGHPAIAFSDTPLSRLCYLKFNGVTWDNTYVDDTIEGGKYPSLGFDNSGMPCIAYYVTKNLETQTLYDLRYSRYDGVDWVGTDVSIGIVSKDTGYYPRLKFDLDGNPCISYFEWGHSTSAQYARFDGEEWILETPQQEGIVGLYSSLVFDNDGNANIFYFDMENSTLRWAKRVPEE